MRKNLRNLDSDTLKTQIVTRRAFILGAGKLGLFSLLASKMLYMQFIKEDEYKTLSDKNRISLILLTPERGQIYDNQGMLLADNTASFKLLLDKTPQIDFVSEVKKVAELLDLTQDQYKYIIKKCTKANYRVPITILDQLTWQQVSLIEENKLNLSSIFIDVSQTRFYLNSFTTSHILGYIGQVNDQELKDLKLSQRDFSIGKSGIEKYYEGLLRGEFGYKQMEVNAYGKYIRELSQSSPTQGQKLHLNIDGELQNKTWEYLNRQGCSAIVMDSTNGNVLLLSSTPGFNPNNFNKLTLEYWQSLINNSYKPLINKTVQNNYPPGSPFKIITILAALEAGYSTDKTVTCIGGACALGNNGFRCHSKEGHGKLDMYGALKYSCNAYMYEISRLIGADKIIDMAKRFGFGMSTGVDLPNEMSGFVPTKKWKKERFKSDWSLGDTLNLSIGQGFLLATPMQLARFSASLASGGKLYTPQVAKKDSKFKQIDINSEYLDIVKEAMYMAVNTSGGTGYSNRNVGGVHELAGKTGTAQVQSKANADDDLSRESIQWEKRNHAMFIGFGPYKSPRYAISVYVDHGGGGGRAAVPIARRIMKDVFEKYC